MVCDLTCVANADRRQRDQGCPRSRAWVAWCGLALVVAVYGVALRAAAATWWSAKGGDPGVGVLLAASTVDAVGIGALVGALAATTGSARGWPTSTLLLITAIVMQPIGASLAFGFHDTELALGWSCVSLAVLAAAAIVERRRRLTMLMLGLALAAAASFAWSLLLVTPL